jgi:hypothetical protein
MGSVRAPLKSEFSIIALQSDFFPAGACDDDMADAPLGIRNEFDLWLGGTLHCDGLGEGLAVESEV